MFKRPRFPLKLGQATHETRPHVIPRPGDLTPGITAVEYHRRRLELAARLPKNSMTLLVGNTTQYSSGSVFYDFQQDNNLYYLTGWLEPNSIAVIERDHHDDVHLHMLVPEKNPSQEIWEGERSGLQGCYEFFNPDFVQDITKAKSYLSDLMKRNEYIFVDKKIYNSEFGKFFQIHKDEANHETVNQLLKLHATNKTVKPVNSIVAQMREVKSPAEIRVLHKACKISSQVINKAIAQTGSDSPPLSEKALAAYLQYEFVKSGCDKQAYIPVVAGGENALIIHYTRNDDLLYKDELVFIDAGGKLGGYCADISRTWPVSGRFSAPQRDIYEAVLSVNKACIDQCSQDNQMSINDLHEFSVNKLHANVKNLPGFSGVSRLELTRYLYPHYVGHHLGLDLHDVPSVSKFKKLGAGNVVTIEPGLYVPKDSRFPKHYHGIGVRVEDDVVVGKTPVNLTSGCVKEVADIEALIAAGRCTTPGIYDEPAAIEID